MYDICVVGAGMVGSAAAKWLSKLHGDMKVCLIGPQEPTEKEWQKREIFSAHYDEGRLTREMDESLIWALLAQRSIQEYKNIEKESGISFYKEVGCAFIDTQDAASIRVTKQNATKTGVTYKELDAARFHSQFPYLRAEESWRILYNFEKAGHISARNIVAAQQKIASSHGCDIINDVVVQVQDVDDSEDERVKVICQSGDEVSSRRVLLCTGAYSNCYDLLPEGRQIDFHPTTIFVVKAEVSQEYAMEHADMPCLLTSIPGKKSYMLPPIKYPDGRYYLKIGGWRKNTTGTSSLKDMSEWYRSGSPNEEDKESVFNILKYFVPDLDPISVTASPCVASHTPTDLLYCDMVTTRLGAVLGLTGRGAKSSNEIGRMAAQMIAKGAWDYDLPAELFQIKYKKIDKAKL